MSADLNIGSNLFWADQDLVVELRQKGDDLSLRAAASIEWLRNEMVDPKEYMRVSNERGRLLLEIDALLKANVA